MKKTLTLFLTVLLTLASMKNFFAQHSFNVTYVGEASIISPPPHSIKVEADYDRHNFFTSSSNNHFSQTTHVVESKHIADGATVAYLPYPSPSTSQTFELFHLKVTWIAYQNGYLISRIYTFNDLQILSANNGNEIDLTIQGARIRLKATSSGGHFTYQITLQSL